MRDRGGLSLAATLLLLLGGAARGDEGTPTVAFLEGDAGRDAFVDEALEPYFSLLEPMDIATKTGHVLEAQDLAAQREECRRRYRAAVEDFTADEKAALTAIAGRIHAAWKDDYPLFASTPWSFLKVAPTVEGGLPHTRGRAIVLPRSAVTFVTRLSRGSARAADGVLAELLVHEQAHVVQRLHPAVFGELYTGAWGFVHANLIEPNDWLERRKIMNPDGVDLGWVFPVAEEGGTGFVQPFLILSDGPEPRRMPGDIREIAVSLVKDGGNFRAKTDAEGLPVVRPLRSVREYQERFGAVDEIFHPNEIFACLFSRMVVRDHFGGKGLGRPCEIVGADFEKLRAWCREHLGARAPGGK